VDGSDDTIEHVLAHPELEVWPAQLTDRSLDFASVDLLICAHAPRCDRPPILRPNGERRRFRE
jgi:hypothetical protein